MKQRKWSFAPGADFPARTFLDALCAGRMDEKGMQKGPCPNWKAVRGTVSADVQFDGVIAYNRIRIGKKKRGAEGARQWTTIAGRT